VTGVDIDPALVEASQALNPDVTWLQGDLTLLPEVLDVSAQFDAIVCAGNVVGFLAPSTRTRVLANFASVLAEGGRAVVGFGAGRGYSFDDFFADAEHAGLQVQGKFSTWELHPFAEDSTFLVAVLAKA
jgi:SAM-dependent methyltransferase